MLSSVRITILSENRVNNPRLSAEQGLSLFIETEHGNLLFDCGQTDVLLKNASEIGIDLGKLSAIILSHGHYDHCGGLAALISTFGRTDVYCHPASVNRKYRVYPEGRLEIGVPWEQVTLQELGANFKFSTRQHELFEDVWLTGEIPRHSEFEHIDESYQQRVKESFITDELHDDLALALNTRNGLIVILGCGHAGVINTVKQAMRVAGQKHVYAVVGGMHLYQADKVRIDREALALEAISPDLILPLHCTGFQMIQRLYGIFDDKVKLLQVGDHFTME